MRKALPLAASIFFLATCGEPPLERSSPPPAGPSPATHEESPPIGEAVVVEESRAPRALPRVENVVDDGETRTSVLPYTVDSDAHAQFLELLNQERTSRGLNALHVFWDIEDDAHRQTERMIDAGEIFHNGDLGSITRPGIWSRLGENVGVGGSPSSLHQAFMNSPGHRDNVLGDYTHVGIGPQRDDDGTLYVTFVFMKATVPGLEDTLGPFVDDDGNIHEYGISRIAEEGITVGCDSTGRRFCPDRAVTRGQMAAFLVRAFDLPQTDEDFFTDDEGTWYEGVANRLAASGVTKGCNREGTIYCGEDEVTRGQMAVFLTRALGLPPASEDYFADDVGRFYEDAANRMYESGITRGCGGDRYCGERAVTRAEMATFLTRALGL